MGELKFPVCGVITKELPEWTPMYHSQETPQHSLL